MPLVPCFEAVYLSGCIRGKRRRVRLKQERVRMLMRLALSTPVFVTAVDKRVGKVAFSEIMIMAKNIAWLMVWPQF